MDWHPRGSLLGVAGYGGVSIYNAQDQTEKPILLKRKGSLLSLSWSPDGKYILAGCQDNAVALWRFRTQQNAQMSGFDYKPLQLTWLNRGKKLITGGTKELVIWPFDKRALKDALQKRVRFMSMQYVQLPQHLTVRSLPVVVGLVALLFGARKGIQNLCAGLSLTAVLNIYIGVLTKVKNSCSKFTPGSSDPL